MGHMLCSHNDICPWPISGVISHGVNSNFATITCIPHAKQRGAWHGSEQQLTAQVNPETFPEHTFGNASVRTVKQ